MNQPTRWLARTLVCTLMFINQSSAADPSTPLVIPLWEGVAPGSENFTGKEVYEQRGTNELSNRWLKGTSKPIVTIYHPKQERSRQAAILVFPGGGYGGLAIDKEGHHVAQWFAEQGMLAGVVGYRCGGGVHQHPVPLSDAQQAIKIVRERAEEWKLDPQKVGVIGFSAGGHLASTAATHGGPDVRPNFAAFIYPVISFRDGITHQGSRQKLLGKSPDESQIANFSNDEQVDQKTPSTFLVHATDDKGVPVENSLRFYEACRKSGVPAELHIYPKGGHGYGMKLGPDWAPSLEAWLLTNGWIGAAK